MDLDSFYDCYLIISENAPDKLSEYCKDRAEDLGVTEEYFILEFLFGDGENFDEV